jgi:hypothetical protein
MPLDRKKAVDRIKIAVVVLNIILASITLVSLYSVASGAVEVKVPEADDFAWAVDTRDREVEFIANFTVTNHGLYDVDNLDIRAEVSTEKGNVLIDHEMNDLRIPGGQTSEFAVEAVLPFDRIDMEEWRDLMMNDSSFFLDLDIRANYLWGLSTFSLEETLRYPWEAPVKRLNGTVDPYYVDLLKLMLSDNASIESLLDSVVDKFGQSTLLDTFEWEYSSFRLECWPLSEDTKRVVARMDVDLLDGAFDLAVELSILLLMEDGNYGVAFESFVISFT